MGGSLSLGRIAGIEISVHVSWLFAFGLVTWSLAQGQLPDSYPRWSPLTYWVTGAVGAVLLFACVLIHELSHSLMARARGMPVAGITLFIFGGVTSIQGDAEQPSDEFWMALVGPLASFGLAAAAWMLLGLLQQPCNPLLPSFATRGCQPAGALLAYLAFTNLALGVFNLIPGFPLDGGRVLRSILWGALGDLRRATRIAARIGQLIAYLFILGGIVLSFQGLWLNGIWLAFIGWFLLNAAEGSVRQPVASVAPPVPTIERLMSPAVTVSPNTSVAELVEGVLLPRGARAALVVEDGRLAGLISLTDVQRAPRTLWADLPVRALMTSAAALAVVRAEAPLRDAVQLLAARDVNQLPVLRDDLPVGLISRADVLRYVQAVQEQGWATAAR